MSRSFLRRVFGSWSLERKFLVFFGVALLLALLPAFWAVQNVAAWLVKERTRQAARDFANSVLIVRHYEAFLNRNIKDLDAPLPNQPKHAMSDILDSAFRPELLGNFSCDVMRLKDEKDFEMLPGLNPSSEFELALLEKLAAQVQEKRAQTPEPTKPKSEKEAEGDVFTMGTPNQAPLFAEAGPIRDHDYYYHPIHFKPICLECHAPIHEQSELETPIRIMRVQIPHSNTRMWTLWSYSIMIAIAIATIGITLFLFHWILKRLFIRPLIHLDDVSDVISRGQTDRRANIDTDDEFNELGEAFNRMLRHLTETEMEVRKVNSELDRRVDQLAQVNLQLYEANRLKSEFLANMSHELRTPLNSILGFSEVLQGVESLTDKQKRYASNIQRSGRLLLDMINDILDLAKMEAGKMQVRPTHFDIVPLVEGQCDFVRSLSEEKNIDLQVESDQDSIIVYTDQPKIQQVLTNLLSNAIKFTPEGGLITVHTGLINPDRFFISVTDTGVGIAESDFEIIFEKFRQSRITKGGDDLTREYSGTGLGLSIVRELCKLLGGEVMLSSTLGQGSVFQVEFPVHYVAEIPSPEGMPAGLATSDANRSPI
ncbi:MAG: ATP-binding protein [Pirellulales bacterium]